MNRPDPTDLEEWGTSCAELVRLLSEFEEGINRPSKFKLALHENTPAFQQQLTSDVRYVFKNFSCDLFEQKGLAKASNVNITYPECVHKVLKTMLMEGESQFNERWKFRLIRCEISIDRKYKKNVLSVPRRYEKNQKEPEMRFA